MLKKASRHYVDCILGLVGLFFLHLRLGGCKKRHLVIMLIAFWVCLFFFLRLGLGGFE